MQQEKRPQVSYHVVQCNYTHSHILVRSLQGEPFIAEHISTIGVDLAQTQIHTSNWQQIQSEELRYTAEFAAKRGMEEATKKHKKTRRRGANSNDRSKTRPRIDKVRVGSRKVDATEAKSEVKEVMDDEQVHEYLGTGEIKGMRRREAALERLVLQAHSTKDSLVLTVWDYGGQTVFYNLHHVFLTRFGIYVLVFNMSEVFRDASNSVSYLNFWLNSVALHAPEAPLVLVGTHAGSVSSSGALKVTKTVVEVVGGLSKKLRLVGGTGIFAIDNKSGAGVDKLRTAIETAARGLDFVEAPVSIRWMQCLDKMIDNAKDGDKCWLALQRVREIARDVGVGDVEELDNMLSLFHELGVVLHFTGTESLRQMIITNPQWLIDSITQVIRDDLLHGHDKEALEREGLFRDAELLAKKAIATRDLLTYFWGPLHTEFMLDLMTRMLLLSRWTYAGDAEARERYLVPSLFKDIRGEPIDGIHCKFEFNFLPLGIFQRLVCLCLGVLNAKTSGAVNRDNAKNVQEKPDLHRHWAKMSFEGTVITLEELSESMMIVVTLSGPPYQSASRIVGMLGSMLNKIRRDVMGESLKWHTQVEKEKGSFIGLQNAISNKVDPWYEEVQSPSVSGVSLESFLRAVL